MSSACDQVGVKFRKTRPTVIIRIMLLENIYELSKNVYNSSVRFNIRSVAKKKKLNIIPSTVKTNEKYSRYHGFELVLFYYIFFLLCIRIIFHKGGLTCARV